MFWRKREKAAEPYMGSAFDAALAWCLQEGEQMTQLSENAFDIQLGSHTVHVERHPDDAWLNAYAILPNMLLNCGSNIQDSLKCYYVLTEKQFQHPDVILDLLPSGQISARFTKLMQFQGNTHWMIFNMLSTFDYLLNNSTSRTVPSESCFFYVNGKRFIHAHEGLVYYFESIRRSKVVEVNIEQGYVSFDTGSMPCVISLRSLSHEFVISYAFSEFMDRKEIDIRNNAQLFVSAYRKPNTKTMSYCFENGVSELAISGVLTAGTEARPIFTRTLAEIYQVVLDSTERLKMNPGLLDGSQLLHSEEESLQQAARFHGELMGGSEHLE